MLRALSFLDVFLPYQTRKRRTFPRSPLSFCDVSGEKYQINIWLPTNNMPDFHTVLLRMVQNTNTPDLTLRQIGLLLELREQPQTVRHLAAKLNVSKPAITRGADRLTLLGMVVRKADSRDRRSVLIVLAREGRNYLNEMLSDELVE